MLPQLSVLTMLGICSYEDLKNRRICVGWLAAFAIEGILYAIFCKEGLSVKMLTAMLPGLLLFLLSFVSKGGIGSGDGLLFMVIGIFLGGALYLFVFRKKGKKYEIAFVPFAMVSFIFAERFGCL